MKRQSLCTTKAHRGCSLELSEVAEKVACDDDVVVHLSLRQTSVSSDEIQSDHSDLSNGIWSQHTDDCEIQYEDFEEEVDDSFSVQLSNVKVWNDADAYLMTPPKNVCGNVMIPWTPTANLKLLLKAASPDIRMRDLKEANANVKIKSATKKKQLTNSTKPCDSEPKDDSSEAVIPADWPDIGKRKDKSLGILCRRFLEKYPLHLDSSSNTEIKLNEVAQYLGVSRRRVYDIINVMEAIDYAVRLAKNKYTWHGNTQLVDTISRLNEMAKSEGLAEQINSMIVFENQPLSHKESVVMGVWTGLTSSKSIIEGMKKSLTTLSQKFLMLFLAAPNNTMNLDLSAKVLLGDPTVDQRDISKFKTKKSESDVIISTKSSKTLAKHLSFDQICEAAELERIKLCSEAMAVPFLTEEIVESAELHNRKHPVDDVNGESVSGKRALFETTNDSAIAQSQTSKFENKIAMLTVPRRQFNQFSRTKSDGAISGLSAGLMLPKPLFVPSKAPKHAEPVIQILTSRKRKMEQTETHSSSTFHEVVSFDDSSMGHSILMSPSSGSDTMFSSPCRGYKSFRSIDGQNLRKVDANVKDKVSPVVAMPLSAIPLVSSNMVNVKPCQMSFQRPVIVVKRICRNVSSDNVAI